MAVGALHALSLLLLAAAGAKLASPSAAVEALRQARLPASARVVRLLALGEAAVAALVLVVGGPLPAFGLAAVHVGFAGFVARLRTVATGAPCGCFGPAQPPADRLHVVVNLGAAAAAVVGGATGAGPLVGTLADQPALGLPYLALVVAAAGATLLVLTALPDLLAAKRGQAAGR